MFYVYISIYVYTSLFVRRFIDFFFNLSNVDMYNNDVIYYSRTVHNIAGVISFLSYLWKNFDRKHGFHPSFIDEHLRVLDEMKTHVKYLLHVHQRESGRRTIKNWLESIKYHQHYPIDLNWCCFFHQFGFVLEEVIP